MKKIFLAISLLFVIASCTATSNGVQSGLIYTEWKDRDPISRVDNSVNPTKSGKACVKNYFGVIATGDSSIETAKKNGSITKVSYVDRSFQGLNLYIPIFAEGCTIVNGN